MKFLGQKNIATTIQKIWMVNNEHLYKQPLINS